MDDRKFQAALACLQRAGVLHLGELRAFARRVLRDTAPDAAELRAAKHDAVERARLTAAQNKAQAENLQHRAAVKEAQAALRRANRDIKAADALQAKAEAKAYTESVLAARAARQAGSGRAKHRANSIDSAALARLMKDD